MINTYRRYAPIYDFVFGGVLEPGRRHLSDAVQTLAPKSLLEVGVGTGLTLFRYPKNTRIVGIDLSDHMLERANLRAKNLQDMKIDLHSMDGENMDFPDDSFDCVTAPYVLSVTPNPEKLIAELRRVCKPDGVIFILNHFSGSRFWWFLERAASRAASRIGFRSDFHFDDHILPHNWNVESVRSVNFFGLSKLVKIRNASS